MITSTHNPKIQWVRALNARSTERREARAFVAEGVRLAEEALRAGWRAELVLHTADLDPRGQAVVEGFTEHSAQVELVSEQVMRAAPHIFNPRLLRSRAAIAKKESAVRMSGRLPRNSESSWS